MGIFSKILKKKKDGKDGGKFTSVNQDPERKEGVFSAGEAQKKIEDRYKRINEIR